MLTDITVIVCMAYWITLWISVRPCLSIAQPLFEAWRFILFATFYNQTSGSSLCIWVLDITTFPKCLLSKWNSMCICFTQHLKIKMWIFISAVFVGAERHFCSIICQAGKLSLLLDRYDYARCGFWHLHSFHWML